MRKGAQARARLARIVEIEGCMAQHRTRRTTAKEGERITPEQLRVARGWLEEAFRTMATPEAAALLVQIAATTEAKGLQKAARRALYRLKTMGVDTESVPSREPRKSVLEVPKLPVVAALASQIDFDGNRALYIARRRPFSGLVLVSLIIHDRRGVVDCNAFPVTKKDLTRM